MKTTVQESQSREAYEAPKLQKIEMSETAAGPNPTAPEGAFAMGAPS